MTTTPFDPDTHCTVFEVVHNNPHERVERWAKVREWTRSGVVPADLPFWVNRSGTPAGDDDDDDEYKHRIGIHILHDTPQERIDRWDEATGWAIDGEFPIDLPPCAQVRADGVLLNHGGNGGP